ncbi:RNA polymerase sigma factor [Steroidobacter sp. S1-65]|uniref:RNA polymerase sigma factor n=1 Tax=Steroidobacter gossypii TaxID=2805490 RepID=A0ABS1WZF6_9GAMM|nr:RNA polymerase sigma factor [Steroidobacter gossypii]MBM0106349.1 RNA polymerase sigma factor [Steroidobacter gossypii]
MNTSVEHRPTLRDVLVTNYDRLTRRLARYLGCPELASDCLHDAWLRLGDSTAPPAIQSADAYVYRVAYNAAMDRLRRERSLQGAQLVDSDLDLFVDPTPSPEAVTQARSDLGAVAQAFQCLPWRHQSVLVALRIEERTREDVARRHGISLRTLDTTLRQALQHCAEKAQQPILAGVSTSRRRLPTRCLRSEAA